MAISLGDQIRAAVRRAKQTRYRISQETGISQASLSRFVNGTAGLELESLNRLCEYLDLRIVGPESKGNNGKRIQTRR